MKSDNYWRPLSFSWTDNDYKYSEIDPSKTYKSEPLENLVGSKVMEFDIVTGMFLVFIRIFISESAIIPPLKGSSTCYYVTDNSQHHNDNRDIYGVRVSGRFVEILTTEDNFL